MGYPMSIKTLVCTTSCLCIISGGIGYLVADHFHQKDLLEIHSKYEESVKKARNQEREWKEIASKKDEEYQQKLNSMQSSNDELVDRLRKQLSELTLRVSSTSKSSSKSNGTSRESQLSARIGELVDFSNRCSKSADQVRAQLETLQSWVKETHE